VAYTLQEFRDLVRAQLDTDADDLTDTLVNVWVREGWRVCVNRNRRWPFYRSSWPLTLAPSVGVYPFGDVGVPGNEVAEIEAVLDDEDRPLRWVGFEQGEAMASASGSKPTHWTVVADQVRVFPRPSEPFTFTAYGYRSPVDWVGVDAGASSDLPDEFDDVILNWCLGRAFQRQEDGDLGVMHLDQAEFLLRQLQKRFMHYGSSFPLVLNDGVRRKAERPVVWGV
jgi:hypothetical protein